MPDRVFPILRLVSQLPRDGLCRRERFCGRIEPVTAGDAPALAALAATAAAGGERRSGRGLLDEITSRPGRRVAAFLARHDAAPARAIGLVTLVAAGRDSQPRHSIAWLLVDPVARRRGVGAALVHVALDAAAREGATEVWVETHARWPAAIAFWQQLGFRPR